SMYERGWYAIDEYPNVVKHDWAKYRLNGYLINEFTEDEWANLSALERCSWYYFYVNNYIKTSLEQLPKNKTLKLELETLSEKTNLLLNFCGLLKMPIDLD